MTVTTNIQGLRDPLTWQACEGAGIGPWFDCGPARRTGEVWAKAVYGVTRLCWDEGLNMWADTRRDEPADGEVVDILGFAWTVRWSEAEAAERDRQEATRQARIAISMKAAA